MGVLGGVVRSRMRGEATLTSVGRCPSEGGPLVPCVQFLYVEVALHLGPALLLYCDLILGILWAGATLRLVLGWMG